MFCDGKMRWPISPTVFGVTHFQQFPQFCWIDLAYYFERLKIRMFGWILCNGSRGRHCIRMRGHLQVLVALLRHPYLDGNWKLLLRRFDRKGGRFIDNRSAYRMNKVATINKRSVAFNWSQGYLRNNLVRFRCYTGK